jgi:hypothetical protein
VVSYGCTCDRDIYHKEKTICCMEPNPVQLELEEKSITIKAKILEGVLIAKSFHGHDCYLQLLRFIREAFAPNSAVEATIFIK